ncbi:hypothetical protein MUK42_36452 [Musa troglodytarum]|uniref:Uncharacterized protein n=1 Tax=Musa troglodytarum TaxID=320322 RepID=A0A9E7KAZ7_9LILI|nr:hypothetical protein MUK42_36452 [Musa troglodytarum]
MDLDLSAPRSMETTIIGCNLCWRYRPRSRFEDEHGLPIPRSSVTRSDISSTHLGQPATVKVSANFVSLLSYQNQCIYAVLNIYRMGVIIGGWDKYEGGQIYSVPLSGTLLKQPFAIGRSGSSYLCGFFDQAWKEGMSKDEAGINADGVTKNFYTGDSLPPWHEELEPRKPLLDILSPSSPEPMST